MSGKKIDSRIGDSINLVQFLMSQIMVGHESDRFFHFYWLELELILLLGRPRFQKSNIYIFGCVLVFTFPHKSGSDFTHLPICELVSYVLFIDDLCHCMVYYSSTPLLLTVLLLLVLVTLHTLDDDFLIFFNVN